MLQTNQYTHQSDKFHILRITYMRIFVLLRGEQGARGILGSLISSHVYANDYNMDDII